MKHIPTIAWRECRSLFTSPALQLATAIFALVYGAVFTTVALSDNIASIEQVALFACFLSMFLAPLATMRTFAEESASGTLELLLTAPVSVIEVVLGKFLGAWLFFASTFIPIVCFAIILSRIGNLDIGASVSAILGLLVVGGLFVAVGVLVSSLTRSQIVASLGATGLLLIVLLATTMLEQGVGVVKEFGFVERFRDGMGRGVIDSRDLAYYFSSTTAALFLTWVAVSSRGILSSPIEDKLKKRRIPAMILAFLGLEAALIGIARQNILDTNLSWTWGSLGWFVVATILVIASGIVLAIGRLSIITRGLTRRGAYITIIGVIAVLTILVNLNIFARNVTFRIDCSDSGQNTLAPETRQALSELAGPLEIIAFVNSGQDYLGTPLIEMTRLLLGDLQRNSSHVQAIMTDIMADTIATQELAKEHSVDIQAANEGVLLLKYQQQRVFLPWQYLLKPPPPELQASGRGSWSYNGEYALTPAIKRLLDPRSPRILYATAAATLDPAQRDFTTGSGGLFVEAMRREAFEVQLWPLLPNAPIPNDCDVLVIAGAKNALTEAQFKPIDEYLAKGGHLILFLPEAISDVNFTGDTALRKRMREWGIRLRQDMIEDRLVNERGNPGHILVQSADDPNTTMRMVMPLPRSLAVLSPRLESDPNADFFADRSDFEDTDVQTMSWQSAPFLITSPSAVTRRLPGERGGSATRNGPLIVAASSVKIAESTNREARVVVVGCSEWIANQFLDQRDNRRFVIGTLRWLAGRVAVNDMTEREEPDRQIKLTGGEYRLLAWICIAGVPQIWLLIAAFAWIKSRN